MPTSSLVWVRASNCTDTTFGSCVGLTGSSGIWQATLTAGTTYYLFLSLYSATTWSVTVN